jgi:uncharacterized membrane protein
MKRTCIVLTVLLVLGSVAASAWLYPRLPQQIPTHWNLAGEVDGYGDKQWAAFLMPGILAVLLPFLLAIPWLSPKQFKIDSFSATYWYIVLVTALLLTYIHGLTLWAAVKGPVDITRALLLGLLAMFGLIGGVLGRVRRNFFVGVRTPWTIASERVWDDTHQLAARLMVGASLLGLVPVFLPIPIPAVTTAVVGLILAAALIPVAYSLVLYKRLESRGEL